MLRSCLLLSIWLALAPGLRAQEAPYRPDLDPARLDYRSDYYGVYLKNTKIGYVQTARVKRNDGTIEEYQKTLLRLVSFNQKAEMTTEQTLVFGADAPYPLLSADVSQNDGKLRKTTRLVRQGRTYKLQHEAGGVAQVKDLELDYRLADTAAAELWIKAAPKVGDQMRYAHFDFFDVKMDLISSKLVSVKNSLVNGVDLQFFEVESTSRNKGITGLSRLAANGQMLSDQIAIFELRLEPADKAKDVGFSQDLFVMGLAKIDRALGNPKKVQALVLEVEGGGADGLEDGPRQRIAPGEKKGTHLLKLGKAHAGEHKATEKEIQEALQETTTYPFSHAKIQELAKQAVGDAKSPREKVEAIVSFVNGYVRPSLSASIPQIHDLIDNKKGDCKSYALLVTTLCRAAGVPAREVGGLLYVGDDVKAFGGHAWNEVVLDGVWVPVDASLRQTEVDATHISFGADHRSTRNLLNTLGKLSFRLVDIQRAP